MVRSEVCGSFLCYWQMHGLEFGDPGVSYREALALFGLPISEEFTDPATGITVQYFERALNGTRTNWRRSGCCWGGWAPTGWRIAAGRAPHVRAHDTHGSVGTQVMVTDPAAPAASTASSRNAIRNGWMGA